MIILDLATAGVIGPSKMQLQLRYNAPMITSPFTNTSQVVELPGAAWVGSIEWETLTSENKRRLEALLVQLRGGANLLRVPDAYYRGPAGAGGGAPKVTAGDQAGIALNTDGWPASTTVLRPGDRLSFVNGQGSDEMKVAVLDVVSDSSGAATVTFEPPIRHAPAAGAAIEVQAPKVVVQARGNVGRFSAKKVVYSTTLEFQEFLFDG